MPLNKNLACNTFTTSECPITEKMRFPKETEALLLQNPINNQHIFYEKPEDKLAEVDLAKTAAELIEWANEH